MKRVYIAGPMRGYPLFNFPAFDSARDAWQARGWDVVSPADMDRALDGLNPTNEGGDTTSPDKPFAHYMRRDIEALLLVQAIAFLPGWEKSVGANVERVVAGALNLEMYDALTFDKVDPPELRDFDAAVPLCDQLDRMILKYSTPIYHSNT